MSYEERLKKLLGNDDQFWFNTLNDFVKTTYEDEEKGISDLENLAKDNAKFNEFTKQIIQRKNDLKSVKEEFIVSIDNDFDIENISKQIVDDIQKLDDNTEISISSLVNKKIDSKIMFQIYDLVVQKLKDIGLYMNFGEYENQRVGLPFNIPFKKGYSKNITISARIYNGHYGKGSIFEEITKFTLAGGNAIINSFIKFCINPQIKDKATLDFSIPFSMTTEEISNLNQALDTIAHNYQPYNKLENAKLSISPEYYNYVDVTINNINYSIKKDDNILVTLRKIINYDLASESISKAYDTLVK